MALTESTMLALGTKAPDFNLLDTVSGTMVNLDSIKSKIATVVIFSCNHCPYVIHVNDEIVKIAKEYQEAGVAFAVISCNDVERYPQDSPEKMTIFAKESGYTFPYLYDETQEVAKAYDAACTPDFYVFDGKMNLVYRGQMDGSRPETDIPITGVDLRNALDSVLVSRPVSRIQRPSAGCGIKWK